MDKKGCHYMNGLKFIRIRCNISLSELAEALKVSRQHVSAWENGSKRISENRLNQLSKYFGVDKKYFGEITKEDRKMIVLQNRAMWKTPENSEHFTIRMLGNR